MGMTPTTIPLDQARLLWNDNSDQVVVIRAGEPEPTPHLENSGFGAHQTSDFDDSEVELFLLYTLLKLVFRDHCDPPTVWREFLKVTEFVPISKLILE